MGPSSPLSTMQKTQHPVPPLIGKVPWRKRLTTRLFLWFFFLLALGFTGVGIQVYHMISVRDRSQVQRTLRQRLDSFTHTFSILMVHQDMVGSRDLLDAPNSQKDREGFILLKSDAQTPAFSDISTIEEMRKRSILLPTLGQARRLKPEHLRMDLLETPESIRAYQNMEPDSSGSGKPLFYESRPEDAPPAFVLLKSIPNAPACQSCHNSVQPVLGYVAAYQNAEPFHRSLHALGMKLFWAFLGTLEILVILLIWMIRGKLVTPLVSVSGTMGQIAVQTPDLKTRLTFKRDDEIGQLAVFVNRFIDLFQGWIGEISDRVKWVTSHSELLSEASETQKREDVEWKQALDLIELRIHSLQTDIGLVGDGPVSNDSLLDLMDRANILRLGIQEILNKTPSLLSPANPEDEANRRRSLLSSGEAKLDEILRWVKAISEETQKVAMEVSIQSAQSGPYGRVLRPLSDSMVELSRKTAEMATLSTRSLGDIQGKFKELSHMDPGTEANPGVPEGVSLTHKDFRQIAGLMIPLAQILLDLERKIVAESGMLRTIERELDELKEKESLREARRPVMEMRLREILNVAKELEQELNRFKSQ
ncbi:MAG: HAMP domain-containing protein [Leptospirales bacterium]